MGFTLPWDKSWTKGWDASFIARRDNIAPRLSGLTAWYDFSDSTYLTLSSTAIRQALDRSGNGNDTAVQGTGSARPTFTASQINGLSAGVFDGGDTLALPAALYTIPAGNNTIFTVAAPTDLGQGAVIEFSESADSVETIRYGLTTNSVAYKNYTAPGILESLTFDTLVPNIITVFRSGTTESISINGGTAVTDSSGGNVTGISSAYLGSSAGDVPFFTGKLGEVLVYNRALTAAEITSVQNYLSAKWSVALATPFISSWKTNNTGVSTSTQIKIPTVSTGVYNCSVNWGDGSTSAITTYNDAAWTHTYSGAGTYTVTITGVFRGLRFNNGGDRQKLLNISQWGSEFRLGTTENGYLYGCINLTITATDILDLTDTTNLASTFRLCSAITTIPSINSWNMTSVTTLANFIQQAPLFNQALTLNIPACTTLQGAINSCTNFNSPVNLTTSASLTSTLNMCLTCINFAGSITISNTTGVTNMATTFSGCTVANPDASTWSIASLTNATNMFLNSGFDKTNYNKLLDSATGWPSQATIQSSVPFGAGTAHYDGANAIAGRLVLTGTKGWTISDSGTP